MAKEPPNLSIAKNNPVLGAILSRRDIREFSEKPVSHTDIKEILYAASWAPNHKMTEPFKFTVVTQKNIPDFVEVLATGLLESAKDESQQLEFEKKAQKIRTNFIKVPAFIGVACTKNPNPSTHFEDLLTLGCACQNMLLAAEEKGLGAHWGSGKASKTPKVNKYLGFDENDVPVGLFQLGYPKTKPVTRRSSLDKFVSWK